MKKTLLILFILNSFLGYTQTLDTKEWCPKDATWIYSFNSNDMMNQVNEYSLYKYEKDTFTFSLNLKKISKYHFSILKDDQNTRTENVYDNYFLFYKNNDSVFYINNNNLEFLYTFTTIVGTNWVVNSTSNSYPLNCDSVYYTQDQVIINSLKFDTIDNVIFQNTHLTSSFMEWEYGNIYKNIGPSKSFFASPNYQPFDSCQLVDDIGYSKENKLVSYYDSKRIYSFNYNKNYSHFLTTDIQVEINDAKTYVYPNPINDIMNISNQIENYNIIDIYGREVFKTELINHKTIDVSLLTKGIYHLIIKDNANKKIIKFIKN